MSISKFGAYVETIALTAPLEFVAFDGTGKVWTPSPTSDSAEVRGVAFGPNGRLYSTLLDDDRIRVTSTTEVEGSPTFFSERGRNSGQLRRPAGLAIDRRDTGRVVVADTLNHRVHVFALDGSAIAAFGRFGAGEGQLNHPNDAAVDASGAIFVADTGNDRIVKFAADGTFERAFGGRGVFPGLFRNPTGLDVHGDRLYVADRDNHRIQVFDLAGEFVYAWGVSSLLPREGSGKLHDPSDVAVSPDGARVAVIEPMEDRIQIFGAARADTVLESSESDSGAHFAGFPSVRCDVFAVANPSGPSVSIFDLTIGTPVEITKFGRPGHGPGRMLRPVSVLLDEKAEQVYVADAFAYTISSYKIARRNDEPLRFDPFLARFERSFDLREDSAVTSRWSIEPAGMALGPDGQIFVADRCNQRVVVFDRELNWKRFIDDGMAYAPVGLALDVSTQTLFVAGSGRFAPVLPGRVASLSMTDDFIREWQPANGVGPNIFCGPRASGVALSSSRVLWAVEAEGRLTSYLCATGPRGQIIGDVDVAPAIISNRRSLSVGGLGLSRAEFWKPEGLAIDERERVFVVDAGNHRFQILDRYGKYVDMFGARFYTEAARNPPPPMRQPAAWDGSKTVRTNDGSWRIAWKSREVPIVRGETFTIDAWVFRPGFPDAPAQGVDLRLDAYMPEHLHGMNRIPTVSKREDGGFTIEGVMLHMSGFWELDFDVTASGITERATTRIDLE
ncbi:MAG: NHL repeat-containing protein [Planctomycetota bacterium]|nr:NHL repeat-containing protein [Planctomycetota bacterium]